jgi:hypothetical protein
MNHTPPKPKNIPKLTHYSLARSFKKSTFALKELKRGKEGGISPSTKPRHLPLRKQFHHDSSGNYTSSLNRGCFVFKNAHQSL